MHCPAQHTDISGNIISGARACSWGPRAAKSRGAAPRDAPHAPLRLPRPPLVLPGRMASGGLAGGTPASWHPSARPAAADQEGSGGARCGRRCSCLPGRTSDGHDTHPLSRASLAPAAHLRRPQAAGTALCALTAAPGPLVSTLGRRCFGGAGRWQLHGGFPVGFGASGGGIRRPIFREPDALTLRRKRASGALAATRRRSAWQLSSTLWKRLAGGEIEVLLCLGDQRTPERTPELEVSPSAAGRRGKASCPSADVAAATGAAAAIHHLLLAHTDSHSGLGAPGAP